MDKGVLRTKRARISRGRWGGRADTIRYGRRTGKGMEIGSVGWGAGALLLIDQSIDNDSDMVGGYTQGVWYTAHVAL